jgi:hypothetical protein
MLTLTRFLYGEDRTIGRITYKDFEAWTLELPHLANKPNESCIPEGEYRLEFNDSPKFGRKMWLVAGVPGRSGIRVHVATRPRHLQGCIALGYGLTADCRWLERSDEAIADFESATEGKDQLLIRIGRGEVWV